MRLFIAAMLLIQAACTESTTINQAPPPSSQASGNTRTSDPDGWGGGGTGDGGGGQGVYCSPEVSEARLKDRLIVRDVYEAEFNYQLKMTGENLGPAGTSEVAQESYSYLLKTLSRFYGPAMFYEKVAKLKYWQDFVGAISFVPSGVKLRPSQDANSPLDLPKGCQLVQIAYWSESAGSNDQGVLFVDPVSWKKLDQFNKVALLAHEHYFKIARMAGTKDSDYIRKKLGQLFSTEGLPALFLDWAPASDPKLNGLLPESSKGFKICQGVDQSLRGQLVYYQYQDKFDRQTILWTGIRAGNKQMRPFEAAYQTFKKDDGMYDVLAGVSDRFYDKMKGVKAADADKLGVPLAISGSGLTAAGQDALDFGDKIPGPSFQTFSSEGYISINNPLFGYTSYEKREILPREKLLNLVYAGAIEVFTDNPDKAKVTDKTQVLQALSILNNEIDEGIKQGIYPRGFPKWTAEVQKFEKAGVKLTEWERKYAYQLIPTGIYHFRFGQYTYDDVDAVLGVDGFVKLNKRDDGEVSVEIDEKRTNFYLNCFSYDQVYQSIVAKDAAKPASQK
ncbi:hypothetical protein [Bdellovibrio sp. KM01]|uniref:hypothetical protein n=1 Tax=Bdellovibrio sp. KM01 TaxID=2748865 RepID=UPI001C66B92F|nr:hypothetical protein [Bdellovibrio sp. KM01]